MAPTPLTVRDVYEPEVLTDVLDLRLPESEAYTIDAFAPMEQVSRTKVKLNVRRSTYGKIGQFRATNALTPISFPRPLQSETVEIEIPILAEKEVVNEDILERMNSVDDAFAEEALDEFLDQAGRLKQQNIFLTMQMAFRGGADILSIAYSNGNVIDIDFGMDNADGGMSGTHLFDVSGSTPLTNPAVDIIALFDAWTKRIVDDAGIPRTDIVAWMSSDVLRLLQKITVLMEMAGSADAPRRPSQDQIADFLEIGGIELFDQPYKDLSDTTQYFLLKNNIFLRGNIRGAEAIRMLDGPVTRYEDGDLTVGNNPGLIAETWASADPPVRSVRVGSRRLPLILREGVVHIKTH